MYTVLLVIHVLITLALIGIILFQRSSTDGLGLSGGGNSVMSGRAQANLLTRTTSILAGAFLFSSLALGYLVKHDRGGFTTELEAKQAAEAPATDPAGKAAADKGLVGMKPANPSHAGAAPGTVPALDGKAATPSAAKEVTPASPRVPTGE